MSGYYSEVTCTKCGSVNVQPLSVCNADMPTHMCNACGLRFSPSEHRIIKHEGNTGAHMSDFETEQREQYITATQPIGLIRQEPNYSAQKRRLLAELEIMMARGAESFVLRTGSGDWTLEPIGAARVVRR